ncbi:MAG: hypothetical protein H6Q60_445 [Oscillospiraceae bacterium]|nr:hypothetical protein [Oscillospiraceae bacterium]
MTIQHQHPDYSPEQRKALLFETHRSCRAELQRNMARQTGLFTEAPMASKALER